MAQLASALLVVLMNIKKYSTNQYKPVQTSTNSRKHSEKKK